MEAAWASLNQQLSIFQSNDLGRYWIDGQNLTEQITLLSGPELAPPLNIEGVEAQYSSLHSLVKKMGDTIVSVVVNSASEAVTFRVNLGAEPQNIVTLDDNSIQLNGSSFTATLPAKGTLTTRRIIKSAVDPQVRLDENGNVLVADTLFWPIGFYCEGLDLAEYDNLAQIMHAAGFNLLYTEGNMSSMAANEAFFSACDSLGIKNILGLPYGFIDPALFAEVIQRYLDQPSIISLNALDDANFFGVPEIISQTEAISIFDTSRLRSASWFTSDPLTEMVPFVDLAAMQSYPWGNGTADLVAGHIVLRAMADTARQLGKFPLATPQAFNWGDETWPPAKHLDCQSYLSLITGNKGVIFYTFKDYDEDATIDETQPDIWNTAVKFNQDVRAAGLKEVILLGEHEHVEINFYRYYATWDYGDYVYLMAVNANAELTYDYDIPLPVTALGPPELIFADRPDSLDRVGNSLVGQLTPYQVAAYRFAKEPSSLRETQDFPFAVYPTPFSQRLNIELPIGNAFELRLYDLSGRQLQQASTDGGRFDWVIPKLTGGTYLLSVTDQRSSENFVRKVIVID